VEGLERGRAQQLQARDDPRCRRLPTIATPVDDALNRYHTDPEMFLPATTPGSPGSRVAPSVVPEEGNVVNAAEKASLAGAAQTNVTAMATLPLRPPAPSTCRRYTVP
jgi:hypothetical protein